MPLGHHLEQRRLDLGRGPVDLVGEHEVGHHRPEFGVELLPAGPVDAGAEQVGGHQVGGELDARERAADHPGEGLDRQGLGDARHALDEQVALGQQPDEHPLDQPVLPDDDPLDLEHRAFEQRRRPGPARPAARRTAGAGYRRPGRCRPVGPVAGPEVTRPARIGTRVGRSGSARRVCRHRLLLVRVVVRLHDTTPSWVTSENDGAGSAHRTAVTSHDGPLSERVRFPGQVSAGLGRAR